MALLSFLSFPFFLMAIGPGGGNPDNNPTDVPPCAPKKPAATAARKVVRVDAGPWDKPGFTWGIAGSNPAPDILSVVIKATARNTFELAWWENPTDDHVVHATSPNWQHEFLDTNTLGEISYLGLDGVQNPWEVDPAFFTHFPRLHTFKAFFRFLPPASVLERQRLVSLDLIFSINEAEDVLAALPSFENLRALKLHCTTEMAAERDHVLPATLFNPLTALCKLQALCIKHPAFSWCFSYLHSLKEVFRNNPGLKEIEVCSAYPQSGANIPLCLTLADHAFSHVYLDGFLFGDLSTLDVSCLQSLILKNAIV